MVERDAALARATVLEPEVEESLRDQLRDAMAQIGEGPQADVTDLRRQLARASAPRRERGEIAKMNREHRALLQLDERQFQLEETTIAMPEPRTRPRTCSSSPRRLHPARARGDRPRQETSSRSTAIAMWFAGTAHRRCPAPARRCAYLERA